MLVKSAILCDFAQVREGLITIASGGLTRLHRPELPSPLACFLALVIEVPAAERAAPHELTVKVTGPAGQDAATIRGGFQVAGGEFDPDEVAFVNLPFDLRPVRLPAFGWYTVSIALDGQPSGTLRFKMVQSGRSPQPVAPQPGRRRRPN